MKKISIVVPCYNEQEVLPLFYIEIQKVMQQIQEEHPDTGFELLFINDGSRDGTLAKLRELARGDERVRYISFSRNFGKESGMYAGLENATGDYVVIMDADLQHPPAFLPKMYNIVLAANMTALPHGVSAERASRSCSPGSPGNSTRS